MIIDYGCIFEIHDELGLNTAICVAVGKADFETRRRLKNTHGFITTNEYANLL